MNVSPSFALPLKIVTPYFLFGVVAYSFSIASLILYTPAIDPTDLRLIGTIHLFLLGFVMMIIIGAMGQLSVVVGEVYHRFPSMFHWIFPLFAAGIALLVLGFYRYESLLPYGSALILIGLGLFAVNLFFTLSHSRRRTAVTRSMQWSTLFLITGILIGSFMGLGYAGILDINPSQWLYSHLITLLGGYVLLNIMGVTTVLLPMFGACSRPSNNDHAISFYTMIISVLLGLLYGIFFDERIKSFSQLIGLFSILYYMWTLYKIFTSRKRSYADIWERSVSTAYISLVIALIAIIFGWVSEHRVSSIIGFWVLFNGFLAFLIFGHLYKIVPFLVWFEKYAPLIEEQSVPTLQQLTPNKLANYQWLIGIIGLVLSTFSILFQIHYLWYIGIIALMLSGILIFRIIVNILNHEFQRTEI